MDFFTDIGYSVFDFIYDIINDIAPDNYELLHRLYKLENTNTALILGIVVTLIVVMIIINIIAALFKPKAKQARAYNNRRANRSTSAPMAVNPSNNRRSPASRNKMYNISDNLEDKSSDWLAMQYNEEERSRISCIAGEIINPIKGRPMTARELKQYHSQACDSDYNYQDHVNNHNKR